MFFQRFRDKSKIVSKKHPEQYNLKHDKFIYKFHDLAPIQDADNDGNYLHYEEALLFALNNDRILNIAITGPYGSGKSSIICTFEKRNARHKLSLTSIIKFLKDKFTGKAAKTYKFINISLATFDELRKQGQNNIPISERMAIEASDEKEGFENRFIERSILQQMLYGADANKIPFSRFKRILTPRKALSKSLLFVSWILVTTFFFIKPSIFDAQLNTFEHYLLIFLITFSISTLTIFAAKIYESSFGVSFKKLSLKNAEFEIGNQPEDSILNKHLDEIIYFFQETDYDVVVIEDLDRFGTPEIFIKLREINKLINSTRKNTHKIKFIYALRDDMFANDDRAKFFEFIIPVVPIINNTNSLDKMQTHLKESHLLDEIHPFFLRDVSLYINDMRLLKNIFNEFLIYVVQMKSEKLDKTKLLAMMIYKNIYPHDFENLHNSGGIFFSILKLRSSLIDTAKDEWQKKIDTKRTELNNILQEKAYSTSELIKSFFGQVLISYENIEKTIIGFYINNELKTFSELLQWNEFERLFTETNIKLAVKDYYSGIGKLSTSLSIESLEKEISLNSTIRKRKENIDSATEKQQVRIRTLITALEGELSTIPTQSLGALLSKNEQKLDNLLQESGGEDLDLLKYLVRSGYLDENYHLYISNFFEGRLSYNDRDYLLTIRNNDIPDALQPVDNPAEVCANMRDTDFEDGNVLNVTLFDYLLANQDEYKSHVNLRKAVNYISSVFLDVEDFFIAYRSKGKYQSEFTNVICSEWPEYASVAIESSLKAPEHLYEVLRYVDLEQIITKMNLSQSITQYLNQEIAQVITEINQSQIELKILDELEIKVKDLTKLEGNNYLIDHLYKQNLYEININNISFLMKTFLSLNNDLCEKANYSLIQTESEKNLRTYVDNNLQVYVDSVLLNLPLNTSEHEEYLLKLLKSQDLNFSSKKQLIQQQSHIFQDLKVLPAELWKTAISEEKVVFTWGVFEDYILLDIDDNERALAEGFITEQLKQPKIVESLAHEDIFPLSLKEGTNRIGWFFISNEAIKDEDYERLLSSLEFNFTFNNIPSKISAAKVKSLIEHKVVVLNESTYESVSQDNELLAVMISKNINIYLNNKDIYPIEQSVLESVLLSKDVPENLKIDLVDDLSVDNLSQRSSELASTIAGLFIKADTDLAQYEKELFKFVIVKAENIELSIRCFSKLVEFLDKDFIYEILSELPEPYCRIALFGKRPKIELNDYNLELLSQLKRRNVLSNYNKEAKFIRVLTFKSPK